MPESELKLNVTQQGADEAAEGLRRVESAAQSLGDAAQGLGEKIEGGLGGDRVLDGLGNMRAAFDEHEQAVRADAEATAKNAAGKSDYLQILRQINPALGQLAETLINASKVAGDLGNTKLSELGKAFEGLSRSILSNVNALKLFAGIGVAVAAVYAISAALRRMREEFEAATKAIREQTEEANRLAQKRNELQQSIEDLSDTRRGGGFSADEAREATTQAQRLRERLPFLSEDAAAQAAVFGRGRSIEDLERIAVAIQSGKLQLDAGMRPESLERRMETVLTRFAEDIARTIARERVQTGEEIAAARGQLGRGEGANEELRRIAARVTEGQGQDAALIAAIAQVLGDVRAGAIAIPGSSLFPTQRRQVNELLGERGIEASVTNQQIEFARQVREFLLGPAQQIENAAKEMADAARRMNADRGARTTVIDQRGSRVVMPSRHAERISNGERVMEGAR